MFRTSSQLFHRYAVYRILDIGFFGIQSDFCALESFGKVFQYFSDFPLSVREWVIVGHPMNLRHIYISRATSGLLYRLEGCGMLDLSNKNSEMFFYTKTNTCTGHVK
jgi:hypothetical protein